MRTPPLSGPAVRVAAALLLCGACFQGGRWYQELEANARHAAELDAVTIAPSAAEPKPVDERTRVAAGEPVGQSGDLITPLNVRDPSALVMGPAHAQQLCPPPAAAAVRPPAKPVHPLDLPDGRLLDLMKKDGKKDDFPKTY